MQNSSFSWPAKIDTLPVFSASVKSVHSDLWHYRLGHLPFSRIKLLSSSNPCISCDSDNSICIVCPLAKQKWLPFPISVSTFATMFDLIHCDVWGPFSIKSINGSSYFLTIVDDFTRLLGFILCIQNPKLPHIFSLFLILLKRNFIPKSSDPIMGLNFA